jgi:predicted membrane chloride channel (bestrophin family)
MIGVEMIAEEIEDPFGTTADDIMLEELCVAIDHSVSRIMERGEMSPLVESTTHDIRPLG